MGGDQRAGQGMDHRKPADPRRMPQEERQGWREGRGKEGRKGAERAQGAGEEWEREGMQFHGRSFLLRDGCRGEPAVAKHHIGEHQRRHRLRDRHDPPAEAGVVAAGNGEFRRVAFGIHGLLHGAETAAQELQSRLAADVSHRKDACCHGARLTFQRIPVMPI